MSLSSHTVKTQTSIKTRIFVDSTWSTVQAAAVRPSFTLMQGKREAQWLKVKDSAGLSRLTGDGFI